VVLVAETLAPVTTSGGMRVLPAAAFAHCPPLDLLLVPGGMGTRREMLNEAVLGFVRDQAAGAELVASVCTGALILGKAGLLAGLRATTHWRSLDLMRELFPDVTVDDAAQVVDEGKVSLDDPVTRFIPQLEKWMVVEERDPSHVLLKALVHPVTVRHLLSHREVSREELSRLEQLIAERKKRV